MNRKDTLFFTTHLGTVYQTQNISATDLEKGYTWAYDEFYSWANIAKASLQHESNKHKLKHFFYTGGWKKFEPIWNFLIKTQGLNSMLPLLESILSKVKTEKGKPSLLVGDAAITAFSELESIYP